MCLELHAYIHTLQNLNIGLTINQRILIHKPHIPRPALTGPPPLRKRSIRRSRPPRQRAHIPLLAPTRHLSRHSLLRNPDILPALLNTHSTRTNYRPPLGNRVLVHESSLSCEWVFAVCYYRDEV